MNMLDRVIRRIPDCIADDDVIQDYIDTVSDRLCLRLGTDALPTIFESVCVDAAVKMYRRTYYEGIEEVGYNTSSGLRGVVYVKSEVKVKGSGTASDPYVFVK